MTNTPDHRTAVTVRSGDDHVIDEDGEIRNAEQAAREALMADALAPVLDDAGVPLDPPAGDIGDPPGEIRRRSGARGK